MEDIEAMRKELAELRQTFDLIWRADRRGVERWRAQDPKNRELVIPDRADLIVWLLEQLEEAKQGRQAA